MKKIKIYNVKYILINTLINLAIYINNNKYYLIDIKLLF